MHRRGFIATAIATLLAPGTIPAGPRPPVPQAPILLQRSPLAGFQYHHGPELWPRLQPGQALRLTREPANPYDGRAVRVDWRGHKLGYVPRRDNAAIAQLLDRSQPLTARIVALREGPDPWQRIEVEIHIVPAQVS